MSYICMPGVFRQAVLGLRGIGYGYGQGYGYVAFP